METGKRTLLLRRAPGNSDTVEIYISKGDGSFVSPVTVHISQSGG